MKAKIIGVELGEQFTDGKTRMRLRFEEADSVQNEIRIHAIEGVELGDTIKLFRGPVFPEVPKLEMTRSQALALLRKAYPNSSINIECRTWSYAHNVRDVTVEFLVGLQPGPQTDCDHFRAKTLAAAVTKAIGAVVPERETTPEEADAIVAEEPVLV